MTASATNVPQRVRTLQEILDELLFEHNAKATVGLRHDAGAYVVERGWVHLVVVPQRKGLRAYEYVQDLATIEKQLRERSGDDQVLIVPAIGD